MAKINSSAVNMPSRTDSPLQVAIIGAGLGGLAAAVSLRRQGHNVTVYERYDFAGEVGASLSAASNGSRFLEEWGVDVKAAKPVSYEAQKKRKRISKSNGRFQVILKQLIMHNWSDGEVQSTYPLGDYKSKFGTVCDRVLLVRIIKTDNDRTITTSIASTFTSSFSNLPLKSLARALPVS